MPRSASIPSALNQLHILPVATEVYPPTPSLRLSVPASRLKHRVFRSLAPLCTLFVFFFELPPFVLNRLQPLFTKHRGWGALRPLPPLLPLLPLLPLQQC